MRADPLRETCVASSFFTGIPHGLVGDGLFLAALAFATREQINPKLETAFSRELFSTLLRLTML
jgi:hypothetical protein